jgi:hypothetical protein
MSEVAGMRTALGAQLGLLYACRRAHWLLLVPGFAALIAVAAWITGSFPPMQFAERVTLSYAFNVLVGLGWGLAVWYNESPTRREHLLAQPADITDQEGMRVLAGALWLLLVLAVTLAGTLAGTLLSGGEDEIAQLPSGGWLAVLTGPLLAYTLAAIASTGTRHAVRTVVAALAAFYVFSVIIVELYMARGSYDAVRQYGDITVMKALFAIGTITEVSYSAPGEPASSLMRHELIMQPGWEVAAALWWTIAIAGLLLVLWRRRSA